MAAVARSSGRRLPVTFAERLSRRAFAALAAAAAARLRAYPFALALALFAFSFCRPLLIRVRYCSLVDLRYGLLFMLFSCRS